MFAYLLPDCNWLSYYQMVTILIWLYIIISIFKLCLTGDLVVTGDPRWVRPDSYVEIDHEILSTVILSLLLI